VGGNTIRTDNPLLTSHGRGVDPVKLVLSRSLDLSPKARVFRGGVACVLTSMNPPKFRARSLESRGVKLLKSFVKFDNRELIGCLKSLKKIGLHHIVLEGSKTLKMLRK